MVSPFRKDQLSPQMQERYGVNKRSGARNTLIAVIVSLFVGILVFVTITLSQNTIRFKLLTWNDVSADRVDITFEVGKPTDLAVVCVVRAQDRNRIDVGYALVTIPAETGYDQITYRLRTLAPAFTAELLTCVAEGEATRVPGPQFPAGIAPPEQPWSQ